MRIAVLIIGLCLTLVVGLQSCAISVGGGISKNQALAGGGGAGLIIAFLFVLGSAFVLNFPRVSAALFALAGLIGVSIAGQSGFKDLQVWGIVSFVLAVMAFFGSRELRRKATRPDAQL